MKSVLNWSSGKDSVFALHSLKQNKDFSIERLLTTINADNNRVSMHGVPLKLVEIQAESIDIPLYPIFLNSDISLDDYNQKMEVVYSDLKEEGFTHSVFGDILLEDLKTYRKKQLKKIDIQPVFPLWKRDTKTYMNDFLEAGYKAIVTVVNNKALDKSFCGRILDEDFLNDLPKNVDPAGENGEFHTFVFDGPLFKNPIKFEKGKIVEKFYSPSKKEKNDCYKQPDSWDTQFSFIELITK